MGKCACEIEIGENGILEYWQPPVFVYGAALHIERAPLCRAILSGRLSYSGAYTVFIYKIHIFNSCILYYSAL